MSNPERKNRLGEPVVYKLHPEVMMGSVLGMVAVHGICDIPVKRIG